MIATIRDELKELQLLVKHFLGRFVTNDTLKYDDQRTEFLVFVTALAALIGWYISDNSPKLFFMTIMMCFTAIYCVLVWDRLLLDQKDYKNLTVLPIKKRTLYISKFLSSLVVVAVITIAFSFLSTLQYADAYATLTKTDGLWFWITLLIVNFIANWFVFLAVASIQSLIMILFRGNLYNRISLLVQIVLLVTISSTFVWFPRVFGDSPDMGHVFSSLHYILPSIWFNGLHQWLNNLNHGIHQNHVLISLLALAAFLLSYILSFSLSLKRHSRQVNQNPGSFSFKKSSAFLFARNIFYATMLRHPVERALYDFFLKHLKRSREQKIKLALVTCLPVGFVLTHLIFLYKQIGSAGFHHINAGQLAFPFILYFALILGLRSVVQIPVTIDANWIFKIVPHFNARYFVSGFKKAIVFHLILPLSFFFFIFYFMYWGWGPALTHTIYGITVALVMLEVFFFNYRKIPFAALNNPMNINFRLIWPLFVLLFVIYYYLFTNIGALLLVKDSTKFIYYPILALILLLFKWYRSKIDRKGVMFEDRPETVMLNLEDYR